jgi:hypothetical protein
MPQASSLVRSAREATAGKWILGAAVTLFVGITLIVFFTGPKWLAGSKLAPSTMQTMQACRGQYSWCTACLPSTELMIAFSAGISLAAVLAGAVLIGLGEKGKKSFE